MPDKRLFLVEGEIASTLKVMERETNTLSPVIRSAWDGGNLSHYLTKTTPLQCLPQARTSPSSGISPAMNSAPPPEPDRGRQRLCQPLLLARCKTK